MNDAYPMQLQRRVSTMSIRETREVLSVMRDAAVHCDLVQLENMLLPRYGLTVGEFSTAYVISMPVRSKRICDAPME